MGRAYEFKKDYEQAMKYYRNSTKEDANNLDAVYATAVAADNYYEDKEEVLKLYEKFVAQSKKLEKRPYLARIAQERITLLKREIFEAQEKKE
jgi:tetratricopeptide (TPR) repeat protein